MLSTAGRDSFFFAPPHRIPSPDLSLSLCVIAQQPPRREKKAVSGPTYSAGCAVWALTQVPKVQPQLTEMPSLWAAADSDIAASSESLQ